MIRRSRLLASALLALFSAAVSSCDLNQTTARHRPVPLSLSPHFATVAAQVTGPINLIRLTARERQSNNLVGTSDNSVSPTGAPWNVGVNVNMGSQTSISVLITVELISKGSDGVEHIEWSGIAGPIDVTADGPNAITDVTLGRGPLSNASITSVTIADARSVLGLIDSVTLTATAAGATGTPTIYWTSLNSAVATVDANGKVKSVAVGTAGIVATAGTKADTANITVAGGPAKVVISPKPATIAGIGGTAQLTATVTDAAGGVVANTPISWNTLDGEVAAVSPTGQLTAVAVGTTRVVAKVTATPAIVDTADVIITSGPAATLGIVTGVDKQSATVGTAVPIAPAVVVKDNTGTPVPNAVVTFAVASGGGTITGNPTITTGSNGVATLGGWTLGTVAGANTLTATVSTFAPVTISATGTAGAATAVAADSGNAQAGVTGTPLAKALVVRVTDSFGNPVPNVSVTFAPSTGGTVGTPTSNTDANGRARTTWTPGPIGVNQTVTATVGTLNPATFTATVTLPNPTVGVALSGVDKVSLGKTATLLVTLNRTAPAGGTVVTLTSGNANVLSIAAPSTVTIPAGQTSATITVNGLSEGTSLVTGTATGFDPGSSTITVEIRRISMAATATVPFTSTSSLPITLVHPAGTGGMVVTLTTSNPNIVGLASTTVTIPENGITANATLQGLLPGQSQIIATSPNYDPDTVLVTSDARLEFQPNTANFNQSFGQTVSVRLISIIGGVTTPIAAPSPGIAVTLTSTAPACTVAPATVTIPTGLVSTTVPLTYGGQGAANCTAKVAAVATNITPDTVSTTVAGVPAITFSNASVGFGLQRSFSGSLGAFNHGGVTVHLASADPQRVVIAPNATTAGTATLDIFVPSGQSSFSFVIQHLGGAAGAVNVNATAPAFTAGTLVVTGVQPGLDLSGPPTSLTTFTADRAFVARVGVPTGTSSIAEFQQVRFGAAPVVVTVSTSVPSVGQIVTLDSVGSGGLTTVVAGQVQSQSTVTAGGVAFRPVSGGTTNVTASSPGYISTTAATIGVTVTAPNVTTTGTVVGAGLERPATVSLGAANHGGVTVHIVSNNSQLALVAANATDLGAASIDVPVPNGSTSFSYYVQALDGTTGTTTITVSAPGFNTGTGNVTVQTPVLDVSGISTTTTTLAPNDAFNVRIGIGTTAGINEFQTRRGGAPPLTVTVTSSVPSVGQVLTASTPGSPITMTIAPNSASTPSGLTNGGAEFDPIAAGTTVVSASIPGFSATTASAQTVTVTASSISLSNLTVGAGLQRGVTGFLSSSAHGGVNVVLTSSDPTKFKLAKDASTLATDQITIAVPNGSTGFTYWVAGMEGATGTPTLTAAAPGFTNGSATMTIVAPAVQISGVPANQTTLDPDDPFSVSVGIPTGTTSTAISEFQAVRAGVSPLTVTITTSQPIIGTLKTLAAPSGASSVTVQVAPGSASSPGTVATGGVAFDPVSSGSTVLTPSAPGYITTTNGTITVNVAPPPINVSNLTIGSGLQRSGSASLGASGHGGVTVTLTSSQPQTALLATSATSAGAAQITVSVPAGQTNIPFWIQGVENTTGTPTITVTAPGFGDGTAAATIVTPVFQILNLPTTSTTITPDDAFQVGIGIGNTSLTEFQNVRFGAPDVVVTLTSSAPTIGTLITTAAPSGASSVTARIPSGSSSTPSTVATGGVALRSLSAGQTIVAAAIPTYNATSFGSLAVTITQPSMSISQATVGAGLQRQVFVSFSATNPSPVTVHVASSASNRALVAPNATTAGTAAFDVVVPANAGSFSYYVSGVEGTTGAATITTSATGYTSGNGSTSVVQPSVVTTLSTPQKVGTDANFDVQVGWAPSGQTTLSELQAVRSGAPASLSATITSSNSAVATVKTATNPGGASIVLTITAPANSVTLQFHPVTAGQSTIAASIPGFISIGSAVGQVVTVNP